MLLTIFLVLGIIFLLIKIVPSIWNFFENILYERHNNKIRKDTEDEMNYLEYQRFQAPFKAIDEQLKNIGKTENDIK